MIQQLELKLKNKWLLRISKFDNGNVALGLRHKNFTGEKFSERLFLTGEELKKLIKALELFADSGG